MKNIILPKRGTQGIKTSFSSPTSTSLHPIVPFFAGVFSNIIYFCVAEDDKYDSKFALLGAAYIYIPILR